MGYLYVKRWLSKGNNRFLAAGIFFIALQAITVAAQLQLSRFNVLFWFCNHTPLLFGLALLFRKHQITKGLIAMGFIAQLIWTFDFVLRLSFGSSFLTLTEYIWENQDGFWVFVPIINHMLGTNLALILTYKFRPKAPALFWALAYMVILYTVTLAFTSPALNVNCIQQICPAPGLTFPLYAELWIPIVFLLIVLPTYGLQYWFYRLSLHHRPQKNRPKQKVNKVRYPFFWKER